MAFKVSVFLHKKASMDSKGKSFKRRSSRTEMAKAKFLSRLCPASCRRVGGVFMLILKDL
jgi:hypothetical protein